MQRRRQSRSPARRRDRGVARTEEAAAETEAESDLLECGTCLSLLVAPVTLRCCGRSVCRHCLVRHLESNVPFAARCPACGNDSSLMREDVGAPSVALRAVLSRHHEAQMNQRLAQLPSADQGAELEQRIAQLPSSAARARETVDPPRRRLRAVLHGVHTVVMGVEMVLFAALLALGGYRWIVFVTTDLGVAWHALALGCLATSRRARDALAVLVALVLAVVGLALAWTCFSFYLFEEVVLAQRTSAEVVREFTWHTQQALDAWQDWADDLRRRLDRHDHLEGLGEDALFGEGFELEGGALELRG
jgi:hypothetical protein